MSAQVLKCVYFILALAAMAVRTGPVLGQDAAVTSGPKQPTGTVRLNFPQEIPIQTLVDYVSQQLNLNVLYDKEITNKPINIKAPGEIPVESLRGVLASALRICDLALVDAEVPGWKKIVKVEQLPNVAPTGKATDMIQKHGGGTPVTQPFVLQYAAVDDVAKLIEPFLTEPGGNTVTVPQAKTLIVTDYATNMLKIANWIQYMDQPKSKVTIEFMPVEHQSVEPLATQVISVLSAKLRAEGSLKGEPEVQVVPDKHSNQLLILGSKHQVEEAKALIKALDRPLGLITQTYQFTNVRASTIDKLVQALLMPEGDSRLYRSTTDEAENLLVVTAPQSVHDQIEQLRRVRDVALKTPESPIRFYKIKNLPVQELLETIRSIESNTATGLRRPRGLRRLPTDGRIRPARPNAVVGPNRMPGPVGQADSPIPPAVTTPPNGAAMAEAAAPAQNGAAEAALPGGELLGRARITGDIHTNTLIVVAEPAVHRLYEELIKKLDQPRPQVMVEAKFVIIDTSHDFSLGVEVSGGDRSGLKRILAFSSYGLSTVDPVTGSLALVPGLGFNGTLVDPQTADVVTRALVTHRRARVTSAPRIVVADNATGQLTSVEEVPFTSVNASQTVATTSFAGFADAGTTITVTPRIRDETSLQLDIAITVNTFTGAGSEGIPPPRQTEEVTSQVNVPDGHTIILGGLNRGSKSHDYKGLPLLNRIPIVRSATGLTSKSETRSSMFVFIRPVILQDDKFRDLQYISEQDARKACVSRDYPVSRPTWMR